MYGPHYIAEEIGSRRFKGAEGLVSAAKLDLGFHGGIPSPPPFQLHYICHAATLTTLLGSFSDSIRLETPRKSLKF